ncbi:MAG: FeoB-associated Cys-rich membrane protein [Proteobacteria bacterium]|nr:FeoB-associated Cys-rich membrane protein [Pseudomonadota bacterium]MBU1739200.1 FeoB-associated Cys-rich membrane protein [Pseudomonadota bacterium]
MTQTIENILLWMIIGIAAVYALRSAYGIFKGKARGCGCDSSCGDNTKPMPQKSIPDMRETPEDHSGKK